MKYYVIRTKGEYPEGSFTNVVKVTSSEKRGLNIFQDTAQRFINDLKKEKLNPVKIEKEHKIIIKTESISLTVKIDLLTEDQIENL